MFNKRIISISLTLLFVLTMIVTYSYIISESVEREKLLVLNTFCNSISSDYKSLFDDWYQKKIEIPNNIVFSINVTDNINYNISNKIYSSCIIFKIFNFI